MFIYQEGKLYVQEGKMLVGVEIYTDKVLKIEGTETKLGEHEQLTAREVQCKFNIATQPYIFPKEKATKVKEVVTNEPTIKTKVTDTKSKRK